MEFHPDPRLAPLVEAALAGARAAMHVYSTDFAVELKADDSPVSAADRNAEHAIVNCLTIAFPTHPIVAEEAFATGTAGELGDIFLLVDPLDGTKEFISRNGEFTVNVALMEGHAPAFGVVLAPALSLAYSGGDGKAWKGSLAAGFERVDGWAAIAARHAGFTPVAVASRSHLTPATEEALRLAGIGERRAIGSSLKFCLLAEGEADFYPRLGPTMEWDTAAGDAVLRAAGGCVVTLDGKPLCYGKRGVAGMREFENPYFLAAGDPALLARLPLDRLAARAA
jgi:3'(2'), 5'-bisphosphate nucleotidase